MIEPQNIERALQSAVAGAKFMASNLTTGNPQIIFAAGMANFINTILADSPRATLSELRDAIRGYARSQH